MRTQSITARAAEMTTAEAEEVIEAVETGESRYATILRAACAAQYRGPWQEGLFQARLRATVLLGGYTEYYWGARHTAPRPTFEEYEVAALMHAEYRAARVHLLEVAPGWEFTGRVVRWCEHGAPPEAEQISVAGRKRLVPVSEAQVREIAGGIA